MLLRRFAVDKDKGKKLDTRWEGPYMVSKVGRSGVSVTLQDIHTNKKKGIYSMDSVKLYVEREKGQPEKGETLMVAMKDMRPVCREGDGYIDLSGR